MKKVLSNKVIRKTKVTYKVTVSELNTALTFNDKQFTLFDRRYCNDYPKPPYGIKEHFTLSELVSFINNMEPVKNKNLSPTVLKGIFKMGTRGVHCTIATPYLWLDIDVKKLENIQLSSKAKNSQVFNWLKKHSIFVYRSHSGKGICACIYVPIIESIYASESTVHSKIGKAINEKLSKLILEELGIEVEFDASQNTFRQARYLAAQSSDVLINYNPSQFDVEEEIEEVITSTGIQFFTKEFYDCPKGSIEYQYNLNTSIPDLLAQYHVSGNRYKLPGTSSETSGEYDPINNVFWNYSTSFSEYRRQTAFWLTVNLYYNGDRNKLIKELIGKGYKTITPVKSQVEEAIDRINKAKLSDEELYSICNELSILSIEEKHRFIKRLKIDDATLEKVHAYLQMTVLKIRYNNVFEITEYVSDALEEILNLVDDKKKILVRSETGTGKTTSVLKDMLKHRSNCRVLIAEPLTPIVDQIEYDYPQVACLTGTSELPDYDFAQQAQMVVATYEQAINLISNGRFDYIIIDEAHNLLNYNSFKPKVIADLTLALKEAKDIKVIAFTGTPSILFKSVGYHLVDIRKKYQKLVEVIERHNNLDSYKILLAHQREVKGKAIYRLNSIDNLNDFKKQLMTEEGYSEDEILVLNSNYENKKGEAYQCVLKNSRFPDSVKVVLTTSMLDEGVSIKQEGFTDVVFIETISYHPTPESLKQFYARFRNEDPNRKNYYYRRVAKKQSNQYASFIEEYSNRFNDLIEKREVVSGDSSFKDLFNDNNYFYNNKSINPYYLAYKSNVSAFSKFSLFEFREYVKINYNLLLTVDEDYIATQEDTSFKKEERSKRAETLNKMWTTTSTHGEIIMEVSNKTFNEELIKVINAEEVAKTFDLDLEDPFEGIDFVMDVSQEVQDLVAQQPKTCEFLVESEYRLKALDLNPDLFLYKNGALRGTQAIRNQMVVAENLALYFNPNNSKEIESSKKLRGFVKEFLDKGMFTVTEVRNRLKELGSLYDGPDKVLIELLKCFGELSYDKRGKKYSVKEIYNDDWVITQLFYIKNKKSELLPNPLHQAPSFGRQLDLFQ